MRLLGVTRVEPPVGNLDASQPRVWTFIGFEIADADSARLSEILSDVLDDGPWYANWSTADEMWVAFRGATFHYPLADADGRAAARDHARRLGLPEPQLDWD